MILKFILSATLAQHLDSWVFHPVGTALTSNWFGNSFMVVVYENFLKFIQNFLLKAREKTILIVNHYKTI